MTGWNLLSVRPAGRDSGRQRLLDDGYVTEVQQQHLLLHSVPYVTPQRTLAEGTLVCKYVADADSILAPTAPGAMTTKFGGSAAFRAGRTGDR